MVARLFRQSLFFLLFVFLQNVFADTKTFKVSFDPDYAPFSYVSQGKEQGLLVDIWKLWAKTNDYKIIFINAKT